MSEFLIEPAALWLGADIYRGPLAIIDMNKAGDWPDACAQDWILPPCPVIGLGDPAHPMAVRLDLVVEPPFQLDTLIQQIIAHPHAAGVLVQVLRLLPDLSLECDDKNACPEFSSGWEPVFVKKSHDNKKLERAFDSIKYHHALEQGLVAESLAYGLLQGSAEHQAWLAARETEQEAEQHPAGALIQHRTGNQLTLTLNRPLAGNAIDRPLRDALYQACHMASLDPTITAIRLHAAGRTFCLGADLSEFGTTTNPARAHHIRAQTLPAIMIARVAERLTVDIQGACIGAGLEMAAFARRITASPHAWFHMPELAMGLIPGAGGCVSLCRRIGRQRTALLVLSGKRITANLALEWGLIDAISSDDRGADMR